MENFLPAVFTKGPVTLIAGPCGAESEEQMYSVAAALKPSGAGVLRAGLWKPRTHPGSFEGVGEKGLEWLVGAARENSMASATEVASASHVEACLKAGVDVLWIGARTTSSPFSVQEIADALRGTDIPLMIKNPFGPDLELWLGAFERMEAAGVKRLSAVHRGFPGKNSGPYRNEPCWEIAAELRMRMPSVPIFCDPSHISGDSSLVGEVARRAIDLGFDGLMVEVHPAPGAALSDAAQQLTPSEFAGLAASLRPRRPDAFRPDSETLMAELRAEIDSVDSEIVSAIARRMNLSRRIGELKLRDGVSIIQAGRWEQVLSRVISLGKKEGLDENTLRDVFNILHRASLTRQK